MKCFYCKRDMHTRPPSIDGRVDSLKKTRDHYMPLSRGGTNSPDNIRFACYFCNSLKGDMAPQEWERFMRDNPLWWAPQVNVSLAGNPGTKKAPAAALRTMTAEENAKRIMAYMARRAEAEEREARRTAKWGPRRKPLDWRAMRPLRPDEPIPIEFDDPAQQAGFEAYAKKYRHVLRVPV